MGLTRPNVSEEPQRTGARPGFQPAHRSAIFPSAIRKITMAASSTGWPVGGRPSMGPVLVPCRVHRMVTRFCFRDQVVDGEAQVGVSAVHRGDDVFGALEAGRLPGQGIVVDPVRGH